MQTKHTPGPWYVEKQSYKSSSFYIRGTDSDGNRLSWAKGAVAHIPRSTVMPSEANARLIAAAPELLDAIIGMMVQATKSGGTLFYDSTELRKVYGVIAKATGNDRRAVNAMLAERAK